MVFNKSQKILTISYCVLLLLVLFALTPGYENVDPSDPFSKTKIVYRGIFEFSQHRIYYKTLFTELGVLSLIYVLMMLVFKSPTPKENK